MHLKVHDVMQLLFKCNYQKSNGIVSYKHQLLRIFFQVKLQKISNNIPTYSQPVLPCEFIAYYIDINTDDRMNCLPNEVGLLGSLSQNYLVVLKGF